MKTYKVILKVDAVEDLKYIYQYLADEKGVPEVAFSYIERLERACQKMELAPMRGHMRGDIRENLRIVPIDTNAVIAFEVDESKKVVTIFRIFHGGQDYETIMRDF